MKSQQPSKSSTTFIYSNRLECGDGVDHNGITSLLFLHSSLTPTGFMAFICPVITVAQITVRLGLANYAFILGMHVALYLLGLVAAAAGNPVLLLLCVAAEIITTVSIACLRLKMRHLFSIPGNVLQDAALVVLCSPCAIAQHIEAYRSGKCMFRARSTLPGYVDS
ncbi:PLAC8 family [Phytophthora infestans]|uniref:PLAC8 family n=1 Tax=Phytophthora infestans TaxID=4787 RepID=A0A8S9U3A6_PHYIN|nr:PLAC8 family [Phytophthora infestans]